MRCPGAVKGAGREDASGISRVEIRAGFMQITVNGEARDAAEGLTVAALVGELALGDRRIAVEVNEDVIPRSQHPVHALREGDRVEIVHAIGGG